MIRGDKSALSEIVHKNPLSDGKFLLQLLLGFFFTWVQYISKYNTNNSNKLMKKMMS